MKASKVNGPFQTGRVSTLLPCKTRFHAQNVMSSATARTIDASCAGAVHYSTSLACSAGIFPGSRRRDSP